MFSATEAKTTVRAGGGAPPVATALKMRWFQEGWLNVILTPLAGATDCVMQVAAGEQPVTMPSIEPVLIIHPQGVKGKLFYSTYHRFT